MRGCPLHERKKRSRGLALVAVHPIGTSHDRGKRETMDDKIREVIGYQCHVCGAKFDVHSCGEHIAATGHSDFKVIMEGDSDA